MCVISSREFFNVVMINVSKCFSNYFMQFIERFINILDYSTNNPHDRSGSNTPSVVNAQKQGPLKNPPMFITVNLKC
jgi:hypothetical protein